VSICVEAVKVNSMDSEYLRPCYYTPAGQCHW